MGMARYTGQPKDLPTLKRTQWPPIAPKTTAPPKFKVGDTVFVRDNTGKNQLTGTIVSHKVGRFHMYMVRIGEENHSYREEYLHLYVNTTISDWLRS